MLAFFVRTDATTALELNPFDFMNTISMYFRDKPILIIQHHSGAPVENGTLSCRRDVALLHCRDDGQKMSNGNSIFIHNFCQAFNSDDDFTGPVLCFKLSYLVTCRLFQTRSSLKP